MIELEKNISNFVPSQFPAFYQEAGPNFILFVKAYYEWMEQNGNPIGEARNLPSYLDIDTTIEEFSKYFKSTYLNSIPSTSKADRAFSLKHIQDLYKAKGTTEAEKLLFRLIFDTDVEVYNPGNDVLKPSDGIWKIPVYIEVERNDLTKGFKGNKITGATSGASAIVESIVGRNINGRLIDILYLSDIVGSFQVDEYVSDTNDLTNAPRVVGSLTSIKIQDGGFGIANGEIFDVYGDSGKYGIAKVVTTVNGSGQVQFELIDGGSGYEANNTVLKISNSVVFHGGNTFNGSFVIDETIVQPIYQYSTTNNQITVAGSNVSVLAANNAVVANGVVVSGNTSTLKISTTNLFSSGATVVLSSNASVNSTVSNVVNSSVTAKSMQVNATAIGLIDISNPFTVNAFMNGLTSNAYALSTRTSVGNGASFQIGDISSTETLNLFDTEYLSSNNAFGVPILNLKLDGSNSNTGNSSYGFASNTAAGYTSYLGSTFYYQNHTFGSILNIRSIRPGVGYDTPPMISIVNPYSKPQNKYDWLITTENLSGVVAVGQKIVSSSNGSGLIREINDANILIKRNSWNGSFDANGSFTTFNSSNTAVGSGNIVSSSFSSEYGQMGNNVRVQDNVSSFAGVVSEVSVRDSGYGYRNNESLTLVSRSNSEHSITGTAVVSRQGKGEGFWENNQGKLNSDKYIHDNFYYQGYSYEIQSELSIDKYADVLKKVFHTAGTQMFGKVVKSPEFNVEFGSTGSSAFNNALPHRLVFLYAINSGYIGAI
ncbi:structural protein [Caulobacter phage Cr30]|uniref:baseplate wedge subunit n=1 Tax=Caulobacter phage Cr30 TaxID=1357714 RepID=UPI0004A9BAD7|nr:baseplate wedge subunit [Caulobacter phage Cr30]AGS81095.1 structural protein [Caulobacter phage Cr30]